MMISRRHDSPLRLENLGHVSGFYGNLPTMREWSPVAPDDKSSPSPVNSSPTRKPYVIESIDFNTSQLIPAKSLHRTQYPGILRPAASSQRPGSESDGQATPRTPFTAMSEYRKAPTELRHPAVLTPGSRRVSDCDNEPISNFAQQPLKSSYAHTSRPVTSYLAYRPPGAKPSERSPDHIIRTSVSLCDYICESPSSYSENCYDARSNYSNATYSHTPRSPVYSPKRGRGYSFSGTNIQRPSQVRQYHPRPPARMRVDGVEFDLVSSNTPAPVPAPIRRPPPTPTPIPIPSPRRSRCSSTSSIFSGTSSNSVAYGAWDPSPIRPKQASFINRARERLERGFVSAGWRSPPSFKVHSVSKSPSSSLRMWTDDGKCESSCSVVTPPSMESSWRERMNKLNQEAPCAGETTSTRQSVAPAPSAEKQGERDQWRASGLLTPAPSPRPLKRRASGLLRIDTNFTEISLPVGIAELEAPLNNPPEHRAENRANRSLSRQPSEDSLFLNHDKNTRNQANSSSFSAEMESRGYTTQMPRAQSSSVGLSRSSLSREQLEFAALPSPLEDLGKPFPFDDRRDLPSQNRQGDAVNRHALSRKKGMRLGKSASRNIEAA
ncbi:hypothetical protein F5B21DRAFT_153419 [Xylaria acuta]|nr:hypothetical protein F5B21DRAFT_153419 [Xylaria acuta]